MLAKEGTCLRRMSFDQRFWIYCILHSLCHRVFLESHCEVLVGVASFIWIVQNVVFAFSVISVMCLAVNETCILQLCRYSFCLTCTWSYNSFRFGNLSCIKSSDETEVSEVDFYFFLLRSRNHNMIVHHETFYVIKIRNEDLWYAIVKNLDILVAQYAWLTVSWIIKVDVKGYMIWLLGNYRTSTGSNLSTECFI